MIVRIWRSSQCAISRSKATLIIALTVLNYVNVAVPANAAPLTVPNATYSVELAQNKNLNQGDFTANKPGSYSFSGNQGFIGVQPSPSLRATSVGPSGVPGADDFAQTSIGISFAVAGPSSNPIPIKIYFDIELNSTSSCSKVPVGGGFDTGCSSGFSSADFSTLGAVADKYTTFNTSTKGTFDFVVFPNRVTVVAYTAFAHVRELSTLAVGGGTASAYIDPVITIDPSFSLIDPTYLSDYALVISSDVGNSALSVSVPEPASAVILSLSILLMLTAGALRRGV